MATPGGLVDKQELIDAQLDTAHLGRVVNSKDASGAPISTSTNRTGGVNKTLDALESEYQGDIDNFVQVSDQLILDKTAEFDDQRDQFETTFNAQFTYKRIGNISDYAGQSLPEADKLNSYQYPDDSDAWYAPVQGQSFPITIPADPTVSGSGWVLTASPNIYRGLWPDTGGSANKGETWQTQTGGTPTGQYFTALQNTTINPISDDVNWRGVVSVATLPAYTDIAYKSVSDMLAGIPIAVSEGAICSTDSFNMDVNQRWMFVTSEPSSGFYLSGSGGWFVPLRKVKTRANLREFGLKEYTNPGVGVSDDVAPLILAAFNDGVKELTIDDQCYLSSHGTEVTQDDVTISGKGKIWVDWSILPAGSVGAPVYCLEFSGENALFKHVDSERVGGAVPWVEDEYSAMLQMSGKNGKVRHTDANYHRNYCFAFNSGKKFSFISNTGDGLLDGSSLIAGVHGLLQLQDTLDAVVRFNSGEGWTNGILLGLSPDGTNLFKNKFRDCGNHAIYGSSADRTTMSHNEAVGQYTDLKVRGDYNTCIGNKTLGGALVMTNRIADSGNGFAANSIVCMNNEINCARDLAVGLSIRARTGFDGPVKKVVSTGNTVTCTGSSMPNGILILFDSIESVNFSDDLTCVGDVDDGIRITPTDGITTSKIKRLVISGGFSVGAQDQSYQITAEKLIMSGFIAESGGGAGASGGGIVAYTERASISGFDIEVTNNIYCINFRSGLSANINCGTLTRPSGATSPHIFANGFTPKEGSEIEKVN